jgi:hypothetical protein
LLPPWKKETISSPLWEREAMGDLKTDVDLTKSYGVVFLPLKKRM